MPWTVLLLHIIKCGVNYVVRKCKEIFLCFIIMYQTVYHLVYYLAIFTLKTTLWKPCIRGWLVSTSDEIFYKQLRVQIRKWSVCLNLLSRGLTFPPINFYRCGWRGRRRRSGPVRMSGLWRERLTGVLSFFRRISVLNVNSENTGSFRCVYFSMPLMATFALQCIVNNLVKDVVCCL
jgi:hypothetical protein